MKIFFTASLTGKKEYSKNYLAIVEALKREGHKVISEHVFKDDRQDIEKESVDERQKYQKQFHRWINQADVVVAEISYPSTGVGYQLTQALEKGTPVLALHVEEKIPIALMGELSEKLIIASYKVNQIARTLQSLLEEVKDQMDVRFNFFISPEIGAYLEWISKNKKLPRAVFLRRLIEDHMRRNREYKGKK